MMIWDSGCPTLNLWANSSNSASETGGTAGSQSGLTSKPSLFKNSDRFFTLIQCNWSGPNHDPFLFFHHIHPAFQPLTERRARHQ